MMRGNGRDAWVEVMPFPALNLFVGNGKGIVGITDDSVVDLKAIKAKSRD